MSGFVPVTKDLEVQQAVPTVWHDTFAKIGARMTEGDYRLANIAGVVPTAEDLAESIAANIEGYGEPLIELPSATWDTSVCMWQDGYWQVLVDLFTQSGRSDLVIDARVHEDATAPDSYRFDICGVYVP